MKHVLVTGATGAIGSALVPLLLEKPDTRVHLLIRATSTEQLTDRMQSLRDFWKLDSTKNQHASDLHAYRGDVCQPRLGLPEEEYSQLLGQLTHVIHCAGNVRLNEPLEVARASAVTSMQHIVTMSRQSPRLEKLDVVSTVGVGGRTRGLIPERPLQHPRAFHNTYEAAKAEAEEYLWDQIQAGLPATIHRPSMVVGDSRSGRIIRFQVFYFLSEFLTGRRTFGLVPDTGRVKLDIVPVDYVARAIDLAHRDAESIGRIFHLCSGPEHSLELSELSQRLRRIWHRAEQRLPKLRRLPRVWFDCAIKIGGFVTSPQKSRALQSLPHFLAYLDEEQTFDTTLTRRFFSSHGTCVPRVDDYLEKIIELYLATRMGSCRTAP